MEYKPPPLRLFCLECRGHLDSMGYEAVCRRCGVVQYRNPFQELSQTVLTHNERANYHHLENTTLRELPHRLKVILALVGDQVQHVKGLEDVDSSRTAFVKECSREILFDCMKQKEEGEEFVFPIQKDPYILSTALLLIVLRESKDFQGVLADEVLESAMSKGTEFEKKVLTAKNEILQYRSRKGKRAMSEVGLLQEMAQRECAVLSLPPTLSRKMVEFFMELMDRVVCDGQNPRFVLAGCINHVLVCECPLFGSRLPPRTDYERDLIKDNLVERLSIKEKLLFSIEETISLYHGCKAS